MLHRGLPAPGVLKSTLQLPLHRRLEFAYRNPFGYLFDPKESSAPKEKRDAD